MGFAGYKPSLIGKPWDAWMDANLLEDFEWGCSVSAMAHRCRRTEAEIVARLAELGKSLENQPKNRKIRDTTWRRH